MGVPLTMYKLGVVSALLVSVSSYPRPQAPTGPLPIPREGSYGPDNYFQYINVPAHKTFEWGYRRGNPDHNREEYLSQKDHTFKAKVRVLDGKYSWSRSEEVFHNCSSCGTTATAATESIISTTTTARPTPQLPTRAPPMVPPAFTLSLSQL